MSVEQPAAATKNPHRARLGGSLPDGYLVPLKLPVPTELARWEDA